MAQGIQNIFLFCLKAFLALAVIGILIEFFSSRKENRYRKSKTAQINDTSKKLIDGLKAAQLSNNETAYVQLCDQAVAIGLNFSTRQEINAYFNPFKSAGFQYPEHGRYSNEYGITFLWVIIYSAWRDHHPNEAG